MKNQQRLEKLKQAEDLIREVEFSYEVGSPIRQTIYKMIVNVFGIMGSLDSVIETIKTEIKTESQQVQHIETEGETKGNSDYRGSDN